MKRSPAKGKGRRGAEPASGAGAPGAKVTVAGRVEMLGTFPKAAIAADNGPPHSGAVLSTATGRVVVHLGPAGFFQRHDFPIRAGDLLEVSGATVLTAARQPVMLAEEVRKNGKTLVLRNALGLPLWESR